MSPKNLHLDIFCTIIYWLMFHLSKNFSSQSMLTGLKSNDSESEMILGICFYIKLCPHYPYYMLHIIKCTLSKN